MATLKSLVDETTNIKNELVECYTSLKNNLIEKGVECSDSDLMSTLIGKVANISVGKKWATGTTNLTKKTVSINGTSYTCFTCSSLTFKPSSVIFYFKTDIYDKVVAHSYLNENTYFIGSLNDVNYPMKPTVLTSSEIGYFDNGFVIPIHKDPRSPVLSKWIAYE